MDGPVVYDTSVLIAAERADRAVWLEHRAALELEAGPLVPAPALAQVWRGGPQARLSRFLAGCEVLPMDEELARAAGDVCGRAGTSDVVDAAVVVTARRFGAAVVTGDAKDVERLVEAVGGGVPVERI
jgi:predicted nucleic acid-binding protein